MSDRDVAIRAIAINALQETFKPQRESLMEYIKYHWRAECDGEWIDNWHYHVMADVLEQVRQGNITRVIFSVPPGSGKTELITKHWPVHCMLRDPKATFIATGYSTDKTQSYGAGARDYYMSDTSGKIFPERSPLRKDTNSKGLWKLEAGGQYLATGTKGTITGERANLAFIIDDPLGMDDIRSAHKVAEKNDWFKRTVPSRLLDPLTDAIVIIHQRYGIDDLTGMLLKDMADGSGDQWLHVCLPSEKEFAPPEYKDLYESDVLQPINFSQAALDKLKLTMGKFDYGCQYLQSPTTPEAQKFHSEHWRYIERKDQPTTATYAYCDPAWTKNAHSDYAVIMIGRPNDNLEKVVVDMSAKKQEPGELAETIINMIQKWHLNKFVIEKNGGDAMKPLLTQMLRERGMSCNIVLVHQSNNKDARIMSLCPDFERGKIVFVEGLEDLFVLEQQLMDYRPGGLTHDDTLDALEGLIKLMDGVPINTNRRFHMPKQTYDKKSGMPTFK